MFKTPKTKDVTNVVTNLAALKVGGMTSRGVNHLGKDAVKENTIRAIIVGAAGIGLAVAYNGPRKKDIQALGLGMALEQLGGELDAKLQETLPAAQVTDTTATKALKATYGLAGGCGCHSTTNPMMLNAGITAMQWDEVFSPSSVKEYSDFEEVVTPAGV